MPIAIAPRLGLAKFLIAIALCALPFAKRLKPEPAVVERVAIHGNTRTRDKVIRRALGIFEGQLVTDGELKRARRRLYALGFFLDVAVRTRPGAARGFVELEVDVREPESPRASGFSSAENFIAICAMQQR